MLKAISKIILCIFLFAFLVLAGFSKSQQNLSTMLHTAREMINEGKTTQALDLLNKLCKDSRLEELPL